MGLPLTRAQAGGAAFVVLLLALAFLFGKIAGDVSHDDVAHAYDHGRRITEIDDAAGKLYAVPRRGAPYELCAPSLKEDPFVTARVSDAFSNAVMDALPAVASLLRDFFAGAPSGAVPGPSPRAVSFEGRVTKLGLRKIDAYSADCERDMVRAANGGALLCIVASSFRAADGDGRQGLAFKPFQVTIPGGADLPPLTEAGAAAQAGECPRYIRPSWDVALRGTLRVVRQHSLAALDP